MVKITTNTLFKYKILKPLSEFLCKCCCNFTISLEAKISYMTPPVSALSLLWNADVFGKTHNAKTTIKHSAFNFSDIIIQISNDINCWNPLKCRFCVGQWIWVWTVRSNCSLYGRVFKNLHKLPEILPVSYTFTIFFGSGR